MEKMDELKLDHLAGREVGTAVLMKELARGAMGAVFIAYQKTLKRRIAVKILPKSILKGSRAALFIQEAESAAILSHPNIVNIYEVGETDEFFFFTMPLIKGLALSRLIEKTRQHLLPSKRIFPLKAALGIIVSVLDALDHAHQQEIVHRDIKPANILIEAHTRRPIITDFGVVKVLHRPDMKNSKVLGTPIYMAPEQITSDSVDSRADIYAVGVVLFELLVLTLPLPPFNTAKELMVKKFTMKDRLFLKKPSDLNPFVGPIMDKIVFKALAHKPDNRYETCREFIETLSAYRVEHMP